MPHQGNAEQQDGVRAPEAKQHPCLCAALREQLHRQGILTQWGGRLHPHSSATAQPAPEAQLPPTPTPTPEAAAGARRLSASSSYSCSTGQQPPMHRLSVLAFPIHPPTIPHGASRHTRNTQAHPGAPAAAHSRLAQPAPFPIFTRRAPLVFTFPCLHLLHRRAPVPSRRLV